MKFSIFVILSFTIIAVSSSDIVFKDSHEQNQFHNHNSLKNCQGYDENGKCLGEEAESVEEPDTEKRVGSRCFRCLSLCPNGYKRDRNHKCRKVL
ncbi:unnamed protein product [Chironomus riparius]|uniref:Uncharacterized protein n=1 Tax=Chironomus riparius TaxID=315576 RepID=A0A9N9RUD0_9DIPT|nr:unnamed protein product [Chironomus riparius]